MELKNRHILITGASRGIGHAFAKICAQDKAHLHIVLREKNAALVEELESLGAKSVQVWECDFLNKKAITQLLEKLQDQQVDILFNNAGILTGGLLEKQKLEDIYDLLQVNVAAVMQMTHGILPGMLRRKRGKIINQSSIAAFLNLPSSSTYAASKAAVASFTNCLNLELKDTGVSTLLLVTPAIKTSMYEEVEKLYGQNYKVPKAQISPTRYAEIIREAILEDLETLEPSGLVGAGLKIAKFAPRLLKYGVQKKFHR